MAENAKSTDMLPSGENRECHLSHPLMPISQLFPKPFHSTSHAVGVTTNPKTVGRPTDRIRHIAPSIGNTARSTEAKDLVIECSKNLSTE